VLKLTRLKAVKNLLHMLHASGVTRLERSSSTHQGNPHFTIMHNNA